MADMEINEKRMSDDFVEIRCYNILMKIKEVLEDDDIDDPECFLRIEKIVCIFEENGMQCGNRHDF